jgi:transglutaminase-like putative cysteine protease
MSWRDAAETTTAPAPDKVVRRGARTLTLAVFLTLFAAIIPVERVVDLGAWFVGSVTIAALVLLAGYIARRFRLRAVLVSLIEAAVWVIFMTAVFFPETALLWLFPTPATVQAVPAVIDQAGDLIVHGAAPLEPSASLSAVIVGAVGLLAIIIDHVVITARLPLLASVGIIAVSLIPAIAVDLDVDVTTFVGLAAAILFLLRAETRSREKPAEQAAERTAGVPATAVGIAAIAVIVAVVASPLAPEPSAHAGSGIGPGPGIDASLQLGDDLRRPQEVEVLQYRTAASAAPYLRATTLTSFDGAVWDPDPRLSVDLASGRGLSGAPVADEEIEVAEHTTSISVVNLSSSWLPIPWAATGVTGLEGDWAAVPSNLTVVSRNTTTQGQNYVVTSEVPRPSREQIRALDAEQRTTVNDDALALPEGMPAIIGELAAEVTADTENDYDALIALQRWFRGGEFRYSLDAPVEEGFDGTGVEAVAQFLDVREGYCVHFASAFALMARTLDMPSRIVVGYLPGSATGDIEDGESVYSVTSDKLHAWPEVYFVGLGWVAFEPTASLGSATSFSPESLTPGSADANDADAPENRPTPTATSTGAPIDPNAPLDGSSGVIRTEDVNLAPMIGVLVALLVLLAGPAALQSVKRRSMVTAATAGDARAAWILVQSTAIDLGIAVPASETPRSFAARLVGEHGAPADAMATLVGAIERASYSSAGARDFGQGERIADAANQASAGLRAAAPASRRVLSTFVPRSLLVRPGSVYAGSVGAPAG